MAMYQSNAGVYGQRPNNTMTYAQDPRFSGQQGNYGQPQRTIQIPAIPGRMIQNPDEVTPNEVPMDGTVSLFPMSDWSAIYAKVWGNDGYIKTFKFVEEKQPEQAFGQQPVPDNSTNEILERLDKIEGMLKKQHYKKPYKPKAKGDVNGQNGNG